MSKIITSLIILTIFSSILCKDYWECDSLKKYTCSKQQTCCRSAISATGWACFPTVNGVCCSDGKNCCPFGTVCNMREMRCDKKALLFLDSSSDEVSVTSVDAKFTFSAQNVLEFVYGLYQGVGVFAGLPHEAECGQNSEKAIGEIRSKLMDIIEQLKKISIPDLEKIVRQLIEDGVQIYNQGKSVYGPCQTWTEELSAAEKKVVAHLTADGFLEKVMQHAIFNIGSFQEKIQNGVAACKAEKYQECAKNFGDVAHLLLFWDYKN